MVNVDLQDFFGETGRVLDVAGVTGGTELFHRYDSYRAYSWLIRIKRSRRCCRQYLIEYWSYKP